VCAVRGTDTVAWSFYIINMASTSKHPIAKWQEKLGNILRSPKFIGCLKRLEIAFRLGFRWGITPIFVGVAICMMSSVAYYWFTLVQPAWEHPSGSLTWCLNTGMGIWLLFNVGWNYFRCMFTPSFHPLPVDDKGNSKRKGDCANFLSICHCSASAATSHAYVAAKTEDRDGDDNARNAQDTTEIVNAPTATHRHQHQHHPSSSSSSSPRGLAHPPASDHWNYCKRCDLITPPRAMHCFLCNRCVLGMDHHCPWLATCIGYHNHAYFFLFLFYVVVGCLYLCTWTVPMFYSIIIQRQFRVWEGVEVRRDRFALTMLGVLPSTFVIAVGGMMIWHGIILACGATSLEFKVVLDWVREAIRNRGGVRKFCCCGCFSRSTAELSMPASITVDDVNKRRHPFDQGGMVENWKETFGVRGRAFWWILWCMPITHERSGNGIDKFVCNAPSSTGGRYATLTV
jgi:hypothetical protein